MLKGLFSSSEKDNAETFRGDNNTLLETLLHFTPSKTYIYTNYTERNSYDGETHLDGAIRVEFITITGASTIVPSNNLEMVKKLYRLDSETPDKVVVIDVLKLEELINAEMPID